MVLPCSLKDTNHYLLNKLDFFVSSTDKRYTVALIQADCNYMYMYSTARNYLCICFMVTPLEAASLERDTKGI